MRLRWSVVFCLNIRPPPRSTRTNTPCPCTALCRSDEAIRARAGRGRDQRRERDHLALRVTDLKPPDGIRLRPRVGFGLRIDLIGAAEAVEVVKIGRAHV